MAYLTKVPLKEFSKKVSKKEEQQLLKNALF